jgi:hypothetical protein
MMCIVVSFAVYCFCLLLIIVLLFIVLLSHARSHTREQRQKSAESTKSGARESSTLFSGAIHGISLEHIRDVAYVSACHVSLLYQLAISTCYANND